MLALIFYFAPNHWLWAMPALFICAVVAAWGKVMNLDRFDRS